ncbi:cysteine desulfurase, mitochondrial [Batrachochytrium salamandrivorans]|nr:cysteine desulfurase, mitochondrial [Batrachochytrium salamandrivorans]
MRQTALARLTALTGPAEQFRGAQSLFRTAGSSVWASRNSSAVYSCASVTAFGLARKSAYFSTTFMPATRSTVHCHATSSHLFHTSTKAAVIAAINSDSSAAESGSSTVISSFSDAAKTSADPVKADTKDSPSSLLATAAAYGWESEAAVEAGREEIANLVGADPKEIIFTSGATESNNLAIKGVARFYKSKKRHIITTQTEHKCVLDSCRVLSEEGFDVTFLPVMSNGLVDLKVLEAAIRPDTSIVSVMTVNNEIGVIQPIKEIGRICREHKVFFHTDAAQAVGKIPIDVNDMNIDLMSISGHKIYGPKGIGALYVRRRPRVRLEPLISGGGQERGLRSGTVPTPLVVGFGEACRLAKAEMETDGVRIKKLSDRLIKTLTEKVRDVVRNGAPESSYPGCVNLSFAYVEGESLLMALKAIALSSGSACTSASLEPSYVLRALGADDETAHSSIRFGIGRFTTDEEVDFAINEVLQHVERLREMSPLWEMVRYFGRNGGAM